MDVGFAVPMNVHWECGEAKHSWELECFCIAIFIFSFECAVINIEG